MKPKILVVSLLAFFALAGSASGARILPTSLARIELRLDGRKIANQHGWPSTPEFGKCARPNLRRYECQVKVIGKRPLGYSYETGIEYEVGFCAWVGVAHLLGRSSIIIVNRRELTCESWVEYSP